MRGFPRASPLQQARRANAQQLLRAFPCTCDSGLLYAAAFIKPS